MKQVTINAQTLDNILDYLRLGLSTLNSAEDFTVMNLTSQQKQVVENYNLDLCEIGAVGDGIADDEKFVEAALKQGFRNFCFGTYMVKSSRLFSYLKQTKGSALLSYLGNLYPFGNIQDISVHLNVPSDFAGIVDCMNWIADKRILGTGEIFIAVADGVYQQNTIINLNHIDGAKIKLVGNEVDCTKCVIEIDNSNNRDCFFISDSHSFGFINGFKIVGTKGWISKGEWADQCFGAGGRAVNGGILHFGSQMWVDKMYYGLRAMYHAKIDADYMPQAGGYGGGFKVTNAGDVGIHAYASQVQANGAEVYDTAHNELGLGFGFCSESGGLLINEYSKSENNLKAGHYALSNGTTWSHGVSASGNMYGVLAWGGTVECNTLGVYKTILTNNSQAGIYATYGGFVGANGASCQHNPNGVVATYQARIDATAVNVEDCQENGFHALNSGVINGGGCIANRTQQGFVAEHHGILHLDSPIANNSSINGFYAKVCGHIFAPNLGGVGNTVFANPVQVQDPSAEPQNLGSYIINQ